MLFLGMHRAATHDGTLTIKPSTTLLQQQQHNDHIWLHMVAGWSMILGDHMPVLTCLSWPAAARLPDNAAAAAATRQCSSVPACDIDGSKTIETAAWPIAANGMVQHFDGCAIQLLCSPEWL